MDKIDEENYKYRVVTLLTVEERVALEKLAWKSGRSMSGFIRHLIVEEIRMNSR